MFNKNNWQEPINREDLKFVIFNAIFGAIAAGALGGALDYLASRYIYLDLTFLILIFVIPWRIKKSFYENHILYAVIGIGSLLLGFFVSHFTKCLITGILIQNPFWFLSNPFFYIDFLISPVMDLINGIMVGSPLSIIIGILNVFCYSYAFYSTYTSIRRKR